MGRFLSQKKGFFKIRDGSAPQHPVMLRKQLYATNHVCWVTVSFHIRGSSAICFLVTLQAITKLVKMVVVVIVWVMLVMFDHGNGGGDDEGDIGASGCCGEDDDYDCGTYNLQR